VAPSCRRLAGFSSRSGIYWALSPDNGNIGCATGRVRRHAWRGVTTYVERLAANMFVMVHRT
jgi:hypothetical protein